MNNRNLPLLAIAALLLLPGCFGGHTPNSHLHTLAAATIWDTFASRDLPANAPRIDIAPVTLPRHLDRPQIVILSDATPDAEIIPLDQHRWATPLDASIRELLAARLLENLPTATIDLYPATTPTTPPPPACHPTWACLSPRDITSGLVSALIARD